MSTWSRHCMTLQSINQSTSVKRHKSQANRRRVSIHFSPSGSWRQSQSLDQAANQQQFLNYNKHTGSVDKSDQMILVNSSVHKTLKWTKKLFFHMLDLSVTNAFILYCKQVKKIKHLSFVQEVTERWSVRVSKKVELEDQQDLGDLGLRAATCFVWSSANPSTGQSPFQLVLPRRTPDVTASSASPTVVRAQESAGSKAILEIVWRQSTCVADVMANQHCASIPAFSLSHSERLLNWTVAPVYLATMDRCIPY